MKHGITIRVEGIVGCDLPDVAENMISLARLTNTMVACEINRVEACATPTSTQEQLLEQYRTMSRFSNAVKTIPASVTAEDARLIALGRYAEQLKEAQRIIMDSAKQGRRSVYIGGPSFAKGIGDSVAAHLRSDGFTIEEKYNNGIGVECVISW